MVTDGHEPTGLLYEELSYSERLVAFADLVRRSWLATGGTIEAVPRDQWPGEIFELPKQ